MGCILWDCGRYVLLPWGVQQNVIYLFQLANDFLREALSGVIHIATDHIKSGPRGPRCLVAVYAKAEAQPSRIIVTSNSSRTFHSVLRVCGIITLLVPRDEGRLVSK